MNGDKLEEMKGGIFFLHNQSCKNSLQNNREASMYHIIHISASSKFVQCNNNRNFNLVHHTKYRKTRQVVPY